MLSRRLPVLVRRASAQPVVRDLLAEMDSIWNRPFEFGHLPESMSPGWGRQMVKESDQSYHVKVELPGVPKEQIHIERIGNRLKIQAEEMADSSTGKYEQTFRLPEDTAVGQIRAEAKDGILTVEVPKRVPDHSKESEAVSIPIG